MSRLSRRHFLLSSAAVSTAAVASSCAAGDPAADAPSQPPAEEIGQQTVAFDGPHQAGIATPAQATANIVGFQLKEGVGKTELTNLLRLWTADARALCAGNTPLGSLEPELAAQPAHLTITCGLGSGAFQAAGITAPSWLRDIRPFSRDQLSEQWGQTDLVLQICSDDPLSTAHAYRHMVRSGASYARVQWLQQGFLNAAGVSAPGASPGSGSHRNLFGQLDGSVNPRSEADFAEQVWLPESAGAPFAGGTVMVIRRIRMDVDTWEMLDRPSREASVGRRLDNGAPLSGGAELDEADFQATNAFGLPIIDPNSHMARAQPPADQPHQRLLRRPYNFELPPDYALSEETGTEQLSQAGQIFICFQQDPTQQFEPIQARLDEADLLNQWITHIGSAVYFIPPGTAAPGSAGTDADEFWAQRLLS